MKRWHGIHNKIMGSAGKKDDDDRSSSSDNSDSSEGGASSIVLSLKDPTYLHVLHRYFRKLGSRSNPTDPNFTEAQAAEEIFDMFNNKGGKFLKFKNARIGMDGGTIEVDEDEAMDSEYIFYVLYDEMITSC